MERLAKLGTKVAAAIAEIRAQPAMKAEADRIVVWEENWPVVQWFLLTTTQWRRSAMTGLPMGLDYTGAREAARMARLKVTPLMFEGLQAMELAYIGECIRLAPASSSPSKPYRRRR